MKAERWTPPRVYRDTQNNPTSCVVYAFPDSSVILPQSGAIRIDTTDGWEKRAALVAAAPSLLAAARALLDAFGDDAAISKWAEASALAAAVEQAQC